MNRVLLVCVTYNDIPKPFNDIPHDILIVDNSEELNNNLIEFCKKYSYKLIINGDNLGIAKALNIGAEYAQKNGYKWIITMDQDSQISNKNIADMCNYIDCQPSDNIAIVSPRHILQNSENSVSKNLLLENEVNGIYTMTSGNMLNIRIWKEIHGFNNELFIDFVDIDFYCKALMNNYKVITLNNVKMNHNLGYLKVKKVIIRWKLFNHAPIRKYFQIRNALILLRRYPRQILPRSYIAKFLINLVITSLFFETNKLKNSKFIFYGLLDFVMNRTGRFNH